MCARTVIAAFLLFVAASAHAVEPCPPTRSSHDWSASCFEGTGEARRVKPAHLRKIRFDRFGKATIRIGETMELLAVNRRGRVVLPNIAYVGDFDYPSARRGIGRFYVQGEGSDGKARSQCGYFQSAGFGILVPARYDHCEAFGTDGTMACTGCVRYCDDQDCHVNIYLGGQADFIDRRGRITDRAPLPTLQSFCRAPGRIESRPLRSGLNTLRCLDDPDNPFK